MEKNNKIVGKFYLKNGVIIEEEFIINKDNNKGDVENFIKELKHSIKEGFKNNYDFQITFGYTMFRGKDVSAVSFVIVQ